MEISKDVKIYLQYQKKLFILQYAKEFYSVSNTLQQAKIPKLTFYKLEKIFHKDASEGLLRKHPVAYSHPKRSRKRL